MASKGQKFRKYDLEFKLKVIRDKFENKWSYTELERKYKVSKKTIESWIRIYKRDGGLNVQKRGRPTKGDNIDYKERYEILKKFQEFLKEVDLEKK